MLVCTALGLAPFWHSLFSKPRDPLGAVTFSGSCHLLWLFLPDSRIVSQGAGMCSQQHKCSVDMLLGALRCRIHLVGANCPGLSISPWGHRPAQARFSWGPTG